MVEMVGADIFGFRNAKPDTLKSSVGQIGNSDMHGLVEVGMHLIESQPGSHAAGGDSHEVFLREGEHVVETFNRENDDAMDASRLQDLDDALEAHAGFLQPEVLRFETELFGPVLGPLSNHERVGAELFERPTLSVENRDDRFFLADVALAEVAHQFG